jgi:hypothetical protein
MKPIVVQRERPSLGDRLVAVRMPVLMLLIAIFVSGVLHPADAFLRHSFLSVATRSGPFDWHSSGIREDLCVYADRHTGGLGGRGGHKPDYRHRRQRRHGEAIFSAPFGHCGNELSGGRRKLIIFCFDFCPFCGG